MFCLDVPTLHQGSTLVNALPKRPQTGQLDQNFPFIVLVHFVNVDNEALHSVILNMTDSSLHQINASMQVPGIFLLHTFLHSLHHFLGSDFAAVDGLDSH